METTIKLVAVALLILLTAFFVASEFAIVKVRRTKLEARAADGNKRALNALRVTGNLDYYLSANQLGITITALGLGWLGEPTLEVLLHPLLEGFNLPSSVSHAITFAIAFFVITFLHVVLGELAPKTVAIQKAENITLMLSGPLIIYSKIMYPLIWLLNGSANLLVRSFGYQTAKESDEVHSEEELRHILSQSYQQGEINQSEFEYVDRIFDFDNRTAKEIMIPRTDMAVVDIEDPIGESLHFMNEERFTRYPVFEDDKDHIIGVLHLKELFYNDWNKVETLEKYVRPVLKVFENIPIHDLLVRMQQERTHLVILTDEYGGTSGMITAEDIIEEIVGDIRDEFDHEEVQTITLKEDGSFIIDGKTSIQDTNDYFDIELENEDVDTISGWMYNQLIDVNEGSVLSHGSYHFKVIKMEDQQILSIKAWKERTANG
ncbi:hemolysin family protein [Halobacillus shinanisalinarum]|uniref:Hemolysin family protein n=1 Tax=Halobacillus shinanisalinarum TaxID=2932258 RepID=A0ABY4H0C9_9BACI|nr:hemolysin family protein [Halobacillus shinanisalinarum]UOQ93896.1 hemolysin family protein [Halobacillus shinanisalinarum]